jgi:hypothetical protein
MKQRDFIFLRFYNTLHSFASYLQQIISDSIPIANSHINNSYELYHTLAGITLTNSEILVSFDVINLFTNIPIELAIEGLSKRWCHIEKNTTIPKGEFLEAIKFVLTSTL